MTSRRNELLKKLLRTVTSEDEAKLLQLTIERIYALNDFNNRDMEGVAEVMQKAISRAEQIDPEKESLFIIQDQKKMQLIHYKHDSEGADFVKMM
jgi:hypothetical protein